jgi:RHS repeat-associated protein
VRAWLYQDQLEPVAELDGAGNVVARFVYGSRPNIPDYAVTASGTWRIFSDHLGSPRLVVNASTGALVQRLDYDEFGRVTFDSNPGAQPFGFAGGIFDADTGLVRFGARDYDAETGRWTTRDPSGPGPAQSNAFEYAGSDPIGGFDATGRDFTPHWRGGGFIVGDRAPTAWAGDRPGNALDSGVGTMPPSDADVDFVRDDQGNWWKVAGPVPIEDDGEPTIGIPASADDLEWLKRSYPELFPGECPPKQGPRAPSGPDPPGTQPGSGSPT